MSNSNTLLDHSTIKSQSCEYLSDFQFPNSWKLTPVRGKAPYINDWRNHPKSLNEIAASIHNGQATGLGVILGEISNGLVAVDVDGNSAIELIKTYGELPETVSITSGKTGRSCHLYQVPKEYWEIVEHKSIKTGVIGEDGKPEALELRWNGHQQVLPPSIHPDTKKPYRCINSPDYEVGICPDWIIALMAKPVIELQKVSHYKANIASDNWTDTQSLALSCLEYLNPSCGYIEWRNIIFAAYNSSISEDECRIWSQGGNNYDAKEFNKLWKSIKPNVKGFTLGSLIFWAKKEGWEFPKSNKVKTKRKRVEIKPDNQIQEFEKGDREKILKRAIAEGYKHILDTSGTGSGKSHFVGDFNQDDWGFDTAVYFSPDHRNPTVKGIEMNFTDVPSRNNGLFCDTSRTTQLGNPYIRHPQKKEKPNIESNCHRADDFHKLNTKGYAVDDIAITVENGDSSFKENPICGSCSRQFECKTSEGEGYGYKHQKEEALKSRNLRMHPDAFPINSGLGTNGIAFWDEASKQLKSTKTFRFNESDFVNTFYKLEDTPEYEALEPLRAALKPYFNGDKRNYYGFNHNELLNDLPQVPNNIKEIIEAIKENLPDASDIFQAANKVSTAEISKNVIKPTEALKKLKKDRDFEIRTLNVPLTVDDTDETAKEKSDRAIESINTRYDEEKKKIELAYKKELSKAKKQTKGINRKLQHAEYKDTDERLNQLIPNWLIPFLEVWSDIKNGAIRFKKDEFIITQTNSRHRQIAESIKVNVYLDATMTREQLAMNLGINANEILHIRQKTVETNNLRVIQVTGLGKITKNRRDPQDERIKSLIAEIRKLHEKTAVIDYKDKVKSSNADGWWGNHNRGTNEFEDMDAIIGVGYFYLDLGTLQDEYLTLKGKLDGFEAYYQLRCDAELIQLPGRLRHVIRPEQNLSVYILTDTELPTELKAEKLNAGVFSTESLTKGEKKKLAIKYAIEELYKNGASNPTYDQIAQQMGLKDRGSLRHHYIWVKECFESCRHLLLEKSITNVYEDSNEQNVNTDSTPHSITNIERGVDLSNDTEEEFEKVLYIRKFKRTENEERTHQELLSHYFDDWDEEELIAS